MLVILIIGNLTITLKVPFEAFSEATYRILGGQSKKNREILQILTKSKTSGYQFSNSNHNSHWIYYFLKNKLLTFVIMKKD